MPPVTPTVRVLYPQLAPARLLNGVFSLDAALQEIIWVVGPVLITLIVAMSGTGTALLIVAAVQVIGGLLFALDPAVRRLRVPVTQRRFGKVMRQAPVALMVGLSVLLIAAMAALEAAIVGTFGEGSLNAGAVLAICSAGSLVGGLAAGNRPITRWSLSLRLLVIVAGLAAACLANGFALLAAALFVAGLGIAPALAVMSSVIAGSVDLKDAAEAYGWIGTGQLLGAALGSAVAGIAIDTAGGPGGLLVSLLLAAATLAAASALRSAQPDLTVTLNDGS